MCVFVSMFMCLLVFVCCVFDCVGWFACVIVCLRACLLVCAGVCLFV